MLLAAWFVGEEKESKECLSQGTWWSELFHSYAMGYLMTVAVIKLHEVEPYVPIWKDVCTVLLCEEH